jgi:hypothetical protein
MCFCSDADMLKNGCCALFAIILVACDGGGGSSYSPEAAPSEHKAVAFI